MSIGKLFRSTLPLEVIVKKLLMTVRPPIQGLQVRIDPIDERVPHLLLERSPLPLQLVVLQTLRVRRVVFEEHKENTFSSCSRVCSINLDDKAAECLIAVTSAAGLPDSRLSQTPLCSRRQKTGSRTKPVKLHSSHSLDTLMASPQI